MNAFPFIRRLVALSLFLSALRVSAFTDADWVSPAPKGFGWGVFALAADGQSNVYVGGRFSRFEFVTTSNIAKWNGQTWSTLGTGMDNDVDSLAISGTNLYAGGYFLFAGGVYSKYIAKWDGATWSPLGSGVSGTVAVLAISGTNLYAGGYFNSASQETPMGVARWNGSDWSPLGGGFTDSDPYIFALAVSGTNLYVGGAFSHVKNYTNTITTHAIAKWDGSSWSALGSGMDGVVYALAVMGTNLYAGGGFRMAGGVLANYIARWDGTAWSALGQGLEHDVLALAVNGTNLYAGGGFVAAGGSPANFIAQWDGSRWSPMGSGVNGTVRALAADGLGRLFVGGSFTRAGTNACVNLAQANVGAGISPGRFQEISYLPSTGFTAFFGDATPGAGYRIQTRASLNTGTWTDLTNLTYSAPIPITIPVGPTSRFYRAVSP